MTSESQADPAIRPRIVAVSLEPPRMPGSGGEVRTYFFLRMLAEFGDLTLISLGGPGGERRVGDDLRSLCKTVIEPGSDDSVSQVPQPRRGRIQSWLATLAVLAFPWRNGWRTYYRYCAQYIGMDGAGASIGQKFIQLVLRLQFRLWATLGMMPTGSVLNYTAQYDQVKSRAESVLNEESFDILWYEHTTSFPFVELLLATMPQDRVPRLICNAHNIEWCLHDRIADVSSGWSATYNQLQARLLHRLEERQFRRCDLVFTCSDADSDLGRRMARETEFVTVGNGVDVSYFARRDSTRQARRPTLLFTGTFGYGPNRDGLVYFLDEILPLIQQQMDVDFVFAGYNAQDVYDDLKIESDRVRCVSSPADIRPCFDTAWIFVVPLRAGSGTRLKILEAMSMGCAIVSTKLGAEGIADASSDVLKLADSPQEFAREVVAILKDQGLRSRMGSAASEWVRERFSWTRLTDMARAELGTTTN